MTNERKKLRLHIINGSNIDDFTLVHDRQILRSSFGVGRRNHFRPFLGVGARSSTFKSLKLYDLVWQAQRKCEIGCFDLRHLVIRLPTVTMVLYNKISDITSVITLSNTSAHKPPQKFHEYQLTRSHSYLWLVEKLWYEHPHSAPLLTRIILSLTERWRDPCPMHYAPLYR